MDGAERSRRIVQRARRSAASSLFVIARTRAAGLVVGWVFAHMSALLPVNRHYETELVLAFHHPQPSYPVHILIVPKRAIGTFVALLDQEQPVLRDIMTAARYCVRHEHLERRGYRLIVNGGPYQDVQQVHFHLISE